MASLIFKNFYDLNFSIIQIELLNTEKQSESMAIYQSLVTDVEFSKIENLANLANIVP
jgi:hypothetical protein